MILIFGPRTTVRYTIMAPLTLAMHHALVPLTLVVVAIRRGKLAETLTIVVVKVSVVHRAVFVCISATPVKESILQVPLVF